MSFFYGSTDNEKIIISVGEKGALILIIRGNIINKRSFINKNNDESQINYLKSLIYSHPNASIYMVLNNDNQIYNIQTMPAANKLSINYLVNNKIKNTFEHYEIKKALLLDRKKTENKNLRYLFIASNLNLLAKKLLELIIKSSKNFQGILLLPIELTYLVQQLEKKHNQNSKWSILIIYTKTNDFRQLILKEGVIISTNTITSDDDSTPDIISGKLYQEIQNSIEYLTKFNFNKKDTLSIYLVTPNEVKTSLLTTKLPFLNSYILTPYELAKSLSIEQDVILNDKSSDSTVLCSIFKNTKNILCYTKTTKLFARLSCINLHLMPVLARIITILFMINSLFIFKINYNVKKKNILVKQEQTLSSQVYSLTKDEDITTINQMYETLNIYKSLSTNNYSPLDNLTAINKLKPSGSKISSFSWNFNKDTKKIKIKLSIQLNDQNNILDEYQKLETNAQKIFNNYSISISKLPHGIDQNKEPVIINVELER